MKKNQLYCGDNLDILRRHIPSESVDLIYIDPPFNSRRDFNIFFDGKDSQTQRIAFEDTWTYKNIQDSLVELQTLRTHELHTLLEAYKLAVPSAFPYLVVMALRLVELHRVLKPTGSFYLHCDPTMSHYLKTICDVIYGATNFRSEIVWKRSSAHSDTKQGRRIHGHIHDVILFYTKSDKWKWNPIYTPYDADYIAQMYRHTDPVNGKRFQDDNLTAAKPGGDVSYEWRIKRKVGSEVWEADLEDEYKTPRDDYEYMGVRPYEGRYWAYSKENMIEFAKTGRLYYRSTGMPRYKRYYDEMPGVPLQDLWNDIPPLGAKAAERLNYPTQKPKALLERIIRAHTEPGDVVLDAFCGCGTTIDAAEGLHRRWIGIDISPVAVSLMKRRMANVYKHQLSSFEVQGIPTDEVSAVRLWQENAFAFQDWWLMEYEVFSTTQGTKGPDKGIDGLGLFADPTNVTARVGFQVKGGKNVSSKDVDALLGAMQKFQCSMGVFMSISEPTTPMRETVGSLDLVNVGQRHYPKLQLLTLHEHFLNRRPKLPPVNLTFQNPLFASKKFVQDSLGF